MDAYIKDIAYYLPERIVTNAEIIKEFPEWTDDKIVDKIGVRERHLAAPDETSADMAVKAAETLFSKGNVTKNDIDFVLLCTQTPDYLMPTSACLIQDRLGLSRNIGALDFNLGCSGYIYGLALAKGLLMSGTAKNVLLLTAETYNKHLHPKDKGNRTIFGDAASASVISLDGMARIGNFSLGTDGAGAENLIMRTGGARHFSPTGKTTYAENGSPISEDHLYMNGPEIYLFTIENVPPLVKDILEKNKLTGEDIGMYIFHQANTYMLNYLRRKMKIPVEKFYINMSDTGNTVSSSLPIAICKALADGSISKGMATLITGFGIGYSWGGTTLHF